MQFMTWERQRAYDFEAGAQQKAEETAINFLKENISQEIIAKCTGLSLEKVMELQKSIL